MHNNSSFHIISSLDAAMSTTIVIATYKEQRYVAQILMQCIMWHTGHRGAAAAVSVLINHNLRVQRLIFKMCRGGDKSVSGREGRFSVLLDNKTLEIKVINGYMLLFQFRRISFPVVPWIWKQQVSEEALRMRWRCGPLLQKPLLEAARSLHKLW